MQVVYFRGRIVRAKKDVKRKILCNSEIFFSLITNSRIMR